MVMTYVHENPPLLRNALHGLIVAAQHVIAECDRPHSVELHDARTSVADWRGLVALRHTEAQGER